MVAARVVVRVVVARVAARGAATEEAEKAEERQRAAERAVAATVVATAAARALAVRVVVVTAEAVRGAEVAGMVMAARATVMAGVAMAAVVVMMVWCGRRRRGQPLPPCDQGSFVTLRTTMTSHSQIQNMLMTLKRFNNQTTRFSRAKRLLFSDTYLNSRARLILNY